MSISHWEQMTFAPIKPQRFGAEAAYAAGAEALQGGDVSQYVDITAHNYCYITFNFVTTPAASGFVTVVGTTEFSDNVTEQVAYDNTTPAQSLTTTNAFQKVRSIKFSTAQTSVYFGYTKQYAVCVSDGGYASHVVRILPTGGGDLASTWTIEGAVFDFQPAGQTNAMPVLNLYPMYNNLDTGLTNQTASTTEVEYVDKPILRFRMTVEGTNPEEPADNNTVYWQVCWRSYI